MFNNWWHKKEMPFRGWTGFGGGATGLMFKAASGIDASGGDSEGVYDSGGNTYKYHKFTSSGSFVVNTCPDEAEIEYMVIGGGGGGGSYQSGGGGAGAYRTATSYPITAQTYTVTVGGAGAKGSPYSEGSNGGDSAFYPPDNSDPHPTYILSKGGGGGGTHYHNGEDSDDPGGGSSGGGGWKRSAGTSGTYGNDGGDGNPQNWPSQYGSGAGGGGGAGGSAFDCSPAYVPYNCSCTPGGAGVYNSILGPQGEYAAGGGGGCKNGGPPDNSGRCYHFGPGNNWPFGPPHAPWGGGQNTSSVKTGCPACAEDKNAWPVGGGGGFRPPQNPPAPSPISGKIADDGATNTGSGGGGHGTVVNYQNQAGNGGSGIVVVRYII